MGGEPGATSRYRFAVCIRPGEDHVPCHDGDERQQSRISAVCAIARPVLSLD